jgi:hypothetical protein
MNRNTKLVVASVLALGATACASAPHPMPIEETHRVAIPGQAADTLAETLESPEEGHVFVHTHDGREIWVEEARLVEPHLVEGSWVLVHHQGGIVPAQVVRPLDDFIELRVGENVGIAPMHAVVAILHEAPSVPVTPGVELDEQPTSEAAPSH